MAIQEIRVADTDIDIRGRDLYENLREHRELGSTLDRIGKITTATVYRLEGISARSARRLQRILLCEPINQRSTLNQPIIGPVETPISVVEVGYKPGVENPAARTLIAAAQKLGIRGLKAADVSVEYRFFGEISPDHLRRVVDTFLVNKTVQQIVTGKPDTLLISGKDGPVTTVSIKDASDEELMILSKDKLFLNLEEMRVIRNYAKSIDRDLTDCELELIAGRWSEHCGHKTFNAKILVEGQEEPSLIDRIRDEARLHFKGQVISAFADNSGVVEFYDGQAICGKVETHNSPSAIEPYGGAMTGTGGVIRDILGTGQGAKTISSTDMFCFAPPEMDLVKLPPGCLSPENLFKGVVSGVRDYGNRMGKPTNNGSVHFHEDFRAKPSVIVGAYGLIPKEKAQKGSPELGDLVLTVGGRTGRDGIHGATFSSAEMTDRTINVNSTAVQIGNAIEEKRMEDAILEARDLGLVRAITDCGAAGFSSAIGEMGEHIGVTVDISNAPVKYNGLAPWEKWMSESQERMVLAIDPNKRDEFLKVCKKYNVEATVLGHFDGSHKLTVMHGNKQAAHLDYDFLRHGLPQRIMEAQWDKTVSAEITPYLPITPDEWMDVLTNVLQHGNVCSKEPIVRQYDHTVQGTNALSPFSGMDQDGPNDGVVMTPILGKPYGMVQSHGMNPVLNKIDPYLGSKWAIAEAMANFVSAGGDPEHAFWINNYIWPFPTKEAMGSLRLSVNAVVDSMRALDCAVVSGKDSLSSTYRGKDGSILEIPPVLCMSVFGRVPDVEKTSSADIKNPGESVLCLVGKMSKGLGGSTYYDVSGGRGGEVPDIDLAVLPKTLKAVHEGIKSGRVRACHDISEGGLATTVIEMCIGGGCGAELTIDKEDGRPDLYLFNETAGCFVVEVKNEEEAQELFGDVPHKMIGQTTQQQTLRVELSNAYPGEEMLFEANILALKLRWKAPIERIFE